MTAEPHEATEHALNIELARRMFAAVASRGDPKDFASRWAAYLALYDDAVVIHEAPELPYGGIYSGKGGVAKHAQAFGSAWDGLQAPADRDLSPRFVADGDRVLALWRLRGRVAQSEARLEMPVVSIYRIKDGRVVESWMHHFDPAVTSEFLSRARGVTAAD
jgi:uncharacterized protein